MKVKGVDFVFYRVSDYKKSVSFYRDVLGLKLMSEYHGSGSWAEFDVGGVTFAIVSYGTESKNKSKKEGSAVALAVPDVKRALAHLKKNGVRVAEDFSESKVCYKATILDPDGNQIILHRRKDGTAG